MRPFCTSPSRLARPRVRLSPCEAIAAASAAGLVAAKFAGHIASTHWRTAKRAPVLRRLVELGGLHQLARGSARRAGRTAADSRSRRCRAIPSTRSGGRPRASATFSARAGEQRRPKPHLLLVVVGLDRAAAFLQLGEPGRGRHHAHPALGDFILGLGNRGQDCVGRCGLHRGRFCDAQERPSNAS